MNLAPDAVTINFQSVDLYFDDIRSKVLLDQSLENAIHRYKIFLNETRYYPEIYDDAASNLCSDVERIFSTFFKRGGMSFIAQLRRGPTEHFVYVGLVPADANNCKYFTTLQ